MSGEQTNHRRCAACKYLRRKCMEDCPLSPYFPPSDPKRFENVHKIFGAGHVAKMLEWPEIPPELRREAANSIVIEAAHRVEDPVYGITKKICYLQQQKCAIQLELAQIQAQIAMYKAQEHAQIQTQLQTAQNQIRNLSFGATFYNDEQSSDANNNSERAHFSDYFHHFPDFY